MGEEWTRRDWSCSGDNSNGDSVAVSGDEWTRYRAFTSLSSRSSVDILKRRTPRIEPWGTPPYTGRGSDQVLLTLTDIVLFDKKVAKSFEAMLKAQPVESLGVVNRSDHCDRQTDRQTDRQMRFSVLELMRVRQYSTSGRFNWN